jgi:hypothetical protein
MQQKYYWRMCRTSFTIKDADPVGLNAVNCSVGYMRFLYVAFSQSRLLSAG